LRAIERLLDQFPVYRGKLTFVQIGAPSRDQIKRYQDLMIEVEQETDRINQRFKTDSWKPIVFIRRHLSHEEIQPYYRQADFCMVTSLHDGMNLVAKEYVASRQDEKGALILSRFAGASHELRDAFIINPYDTDELANAVQTALSMPLEEKAVRMRRMRAVVREHNVYRWAENLVAELAAVRLEATAPPVTNLPLVKGAAARPHAEYGMKIAG
jgi:trehalose 6-phosphate synthase